MFRFMLVSGLVKLLTHDASWAQLTALDFHYETQPLPTPLAWYAHQLPDWFQQLSVLSMFGIELLLEFEYTWTNMGEKRPETSQIVIINHTISHQDLEADKI